MAEVKRTKVVTSKIRFSYVCIFTPQAMEDGGKPKYSMCLMIPKSNKPLVAKIKKAIKAAYEEGKAKFGGKLPKSWKNPLRDGDEERDDLEEFEGMYFINASGYRKPGIVDSDREPIIDEEEVYSGCYGRVSINFYAFNTKGNKGVACGLNHVQKLADGERLGGSSSTAAADFDDDYDDEDDDLFG